MIKLSIFLTALSLATFAHANCNQVEIDSGNQGAMNECGLDSFQKSDNRLNIVYKKLVAQIQTSSDSKSTKRKYLDSLLKGQRAWLVYRDSHCNLQTLPMEGGSIRPLLYSSCLQELTEERTKQLTCKQEMTYPELTCARE